MENFEKIIEELEKRISDLESSKKESPPRKTKKYYTDLANVLVEKGGLVSQYEFEKKESELGKDFFSKDQIDSKIKLINKLTEELDNRGTLVDQKYSDQLNTLNEISQKYDQKLSENVDLAFKKVIDENELTKSLRSIIKNEKINDIKLETNVAEGTEKTTLFLGLAEFSNYKGLVSEINQIKKSMYYSNISSNIFGITGALLLIYVLLFEILFVTNPVESELLLDQVLLRFAIVISFEFLFVVYNRKTKSLQETRRYFINELNNFILKNKGLELSLKLYPDPNVDLNKVVTHFIESERNIVLENGKSTIELEKERISVNEANSLIKNLMEGVHGIVDRVKG